MNQDRGGVQQENSSAAFGAQLFFRTEFLFGQKHAKYKICFIAALRNSARW